MKNKLSLKAAAVTVIILLFSMTACGRTENNIRFGAAETGGNYYIFACALADCLETDAGIDTDVKATAGSAANLRLLSENYIQLGLSQTDVISGMVSSGSPEEGEDGEKDYSKGYSAIAGLYTEACQIVVKADSGIESVYDLRARSVSVGEEESGSEQTAKQILQAYGLNEKLVDINYLNYFEAADALKSGEIEAFFCMASIPTTVIEQLATDTGIMLSLFLGIAMITLKIWQLTDLALPLIILLAAQTLLMILYARFAVFNVMGRDYDAAVITAGTCGFGMGATPNAIANMQAVCEKYVPSIKAFIIIPIVGGLFVDFLNSLVITFFINAV